MINKINYPQNNFYEKEKQKAKDTIEKRKKDWYKIIYIEGVFDLLHPWHKAFFSYIRKKIKRILKDKFKIVVSVESDNIVKRKKWPTRPFENEKIRKENVEKLEEVDLFVINNDQLRNLIDNLHYLKVDYLIISDEYIKNIKLFKKLIIPLLKKNWIKFILSRHKQYKFFWVDESLATIHTTNILKD